MTTVYVTDPHIVIDDVLADLPIAFIYHSPSNFILQRKG